MTASGAAVPRMILDRDRARWGASVLDVPIVGGDDMLVDAIKKGITHFAVGVGGLNGHLNQPQYRRVQAIGLSG